MIIDHIGYLTHDIMKAIVIFKQIGFIQESEVIVDNETCEGEYGEYYAPRNVYICFLTNGTCRVELVSPIDEEAVVANMLKKQGDGPYHICYQTGNINKKIEELKSEGWMVVKKPEKAVAFKGGGRIAFMYKKNVGLIELREV